MSTMQSRGASIVSALEPVDVRLADTPDALPGGFEDPSSADEAPSGSPAQPRRMAIVSAPDTQGPVSHRPSPEMAAGHDPAPREPRVVAPLPRITIHAFCESHDVLSALEKASVDRLMSRATLEMFAGGIKAAGELYRHNSAPNLIIVERKAGNDVVLAELEELAELCNPGTKVLVIGYTNDIGFYRELLRRGVSEYVIAPTHAAALVATLSGIYRDTSSGKLGQVYAFVGTKGGVGSSTMAHNVGWTIARHLGTDVVLADLDLPFGTASLNFNVDTRQGIAEAIQDSGRLDEMLFDRLLTRCDDHFSLLAAPATLGVSYDLGANALDGLLEVAQASVPYTILDIPHLWTSWASKALVGADDVIITAVPDLASLRNAKNLVDFLKQARPHDGPPKLVLNQVGMAKRPEIKPGDFARTLGIEPLASVPFDAQLFGAAANNGKMIADMSARSPVTQNFAEIASRIVGRKEPGTNRKGFPGLQALLGGLKRKA